MAVLAEGTLRDAISLLDQANTGVEGDISRDAVLNLVGLVDDQFLADLADALLSKRIDQLLDLVNRLSLSGRDLIQTVVDLARYLRNVLVCKISDNPAEMIQITEQSLNNMLRLANFSDTKTLTKLIQGLSALLSELRWTPDLRTSLEIGLIRLLGEIPDSTIANLRSGNSTVTVKVASEGELPTSDKTVEVTAQPETQVSGLPDNEEPPAKAKLVEGDKLMATLDEPPAEAEPDRSVEMTDEPEQIVEAAAQPEPQVSGLPDIEEPPAKAILVEGDKLMATLDEPPAEAEPERSVEMTDEPEPSQVMDHEQLIIHWNNVLNELNELGHIDILIMARSSRVGYDGTNWYLNFDSSMNSQFERCSMPDATRLLCRLVSQEMKQPVEVVIRKSPDAANNIGATAEPEWLSRIRKVCQETDVPLEVEE